MSGPGGAAGMDVTNASRGKVENQGVYSELIAMGAAIVLVGLVAIAYSYLGPERARPNTVPIVAADTSDRE